MDTNNSRLFSNKLQHILKKWKNKGVLSNNGTQQPKSLTLSHLPLEILFGIQDCLDLKSKFILCATSHYFYHVTVGKLYREVENINVLVSSYQYRYQHSGWEAARLKISKFQESILSSESFWFAVSSIELKFYSKLVQYKQFLLNQDHCDQFFIEGKVNLAKLKSLKLVYLGRDQCNLEAVNQLVFLRRFSLNYQLPLEDYQLFSGWVVNRLTHLHLELCDLPFQLMDILANTFPNLKKLSLAGQLHFDPKFINATYSFPALIELSLIITNPYYTNLKANFPPPVKLPQLRKLSLSGKGEFNDYLFKGSWPYLTQLHSNLVYLPTNLEWNQLRYLTHFFCDSPSQISDSLLPLLLDQLSNLRTLHLNGSFTDSAFLTTTVPSYLTHLHLKTCTQLAFHFLNFLYKLTNLTAFKFCLKDKWKLKKADLKTFNIKIFPNLLHFHLPGFPKFLEGFVKANAPLLD